MNTHRYRIIFNRARGVLMAVAEIATARGKCPGAASSGTAVAPVTGPTSARLRSTAFATLLALGAQLALMPLADAQIVAYKPAPANQKPTVLTAGNGVPLINIQTPSAAGVSRNTYEQFDVEVQGAILNNSRTNAQTQLGGWVQGNPWLAGGSARVILNEVISANPSRLLGYVEVAGSAAQVVIANPAGISCNGCGFINASRATLTTGTPIVSGGNLEGYRVEGGTIRIEGSGMDASRVGYTDLIARAVEVNAGLWAQTLKVTAGSNLVSADHTQTTPISPAPSSGAAPAFAIDVAQLGGMYAGKITLVGTEAGVGVRNAGTLGASAGEVVVTADGRLTNSGSLLALRDITLNTPGEVRNSGLVSAGGTLAISAATVTNANTLGASQGLEGQALTINADTIDNRSGALRANAALTITSSGSLDNSGGLISSAQAINVRDAPTEAPLGGAAATKTLAITNTAGTLIADQRLEIDSASLTGDGKLLSQGDLAVKLTADYTHTGELTANGRASLETAGKLTNQATLQAGTALVLTAGTIDNQASGQIAAPELRLAATAAHTLTNRGLIDGGDTRIDAVTLNNLGTGRIYGNQLAIAATTLTNEAETVGGTTSAPVIAARNRLDLGVGTLNNREGALIFSAGDMAIGGTLDASNRATGQAGTVNNASATIEALGNLTLNAGTLNNTNEHFSTQLVSVGSVLMDEWAISGGARYAPNEVTLSWTSAPGVTYYPAATDGRNWMGSQGFFASNSNNYVFLSTPSGTSGNFWVYSFTRSTQEDQVLTSSPGKITAGGDMAIAATTLKNDNSHILAGGNLAGSFGSVLNTATPGQRIVTDSGTAWNIFQDTKHDDSDGNSYAYNPGASTSTTSLTVARLQGNTVPGGSGTTLGALNISSLAQRATGSGSLYRPSTSPTSTYLIETDPRFASYRQWLSSDYMLKALALDPATTQKRVGDGFYEQRLITEQIAQLTGRRFLAGYQNEEDQYRALMTAGITFAKEWQLIPGIALTPEQMARLTTDMVWLVEKEVPLADGSQQKALLPQLYARIKDGDLAPAGGLLADKTLDLQVQGKLTNLGTLAGRQLVSLTAENLQNLGGRITGDDIWLTARQDLQNLGGKIDAGNRLDAYAGRNLDIASTVRSEGSQTNVDRLAGLYVQNPGGTLKLAAAGDINLIAAQLQSAGTTDIQAGNNLTLGTVTTAYANSVGNGKNSRQESGSREVGTTIQSNGNLTLQAGNNLTARAADATSTNGKLLATAGNDLRIEAGESTLNVAEQHKTTSKGFLSKKTTTTRDTLNDTSAVASTFSGDSTTLIAGRDIQIKGSNVVATNDTTAIATRNLNIEAATETHNETHVRSEKKSGLFTSGLKSTSKTNEALNAQGSIVSAGRDLALMAGAQGDRNSNLTLQGSAVDAGRDLSIQTTGDLQLLAAYSQSRETTQSTKQTSKKLETLNFDLEQTRALLATLTAGNNIDLNVGGNIAAQVGSTDAAGKLQADRMTAAGIIKGSDRQQVSLTHTDDKAGTTTNGPTSKVLGNLAAQGIRSGANDSFAPEAVQTGQPAVTALMQNGLLTLRNQPAIQAALNAPTPNGGALTYKDDSGRVTLTLAGEAKVQAVYNQLRLTETFDVKHFADQGTARAVTLVAAIALTVCTGGAGAGTLGAALATAGSTSALMINAAFIAMTSTMAGQLAGGASFDQAFQAGLKAGTTSAITAGILDTQMIDTAQGMQSINQLANVQTTGANIVGNFNADTLGQNLLGIGARGVVNAGVSTAINGGSLGDAFRSSVVGDLAAVGANAVGGGTDVLSAGNILGHAAVGCAAAAANGKGCASGAIGGAGAAIANPLLDRAIGGSDGSGWGSNPETAQQWQTATLQLGSMGLSAAAAAALGKEGMTAALAAQNETVNNYLTKDNIRAKQARLAAATTPEQRAAVIKEYFGVSRDNTNKALADVKSPLMTVAELEATRDNLATLVSGPTACNASLSCRTDVRNGISEINGILASARTGEKMEPVVLAAEAVLTLVTAGEYLVARNALRMGAEAVAGSGARGIGASSALPSGATFEGTLYRAVGEGYDPLLIHPGNIAASHRYTGPGQGGLYFATGEHVVEAEFANNGASLAGKQMHSFTNSTASNLLNLSSPATRDALGVSLGDLTRTGGTQGWRYEVTQPLGSWAQQNGYKGIIAPSAQADGGVNVILFDGKSLK